MGWRVIETIIKSKSKTFLAFCFSFLVGVLFASLLEQPLDTFILYVLFLICMSALVWTRPRTPFRLIVLCSLLFILGCARYAYALSDGGYVEETSARFQAYVYQEPDVRLDSVRYIISNEKNQRIFVKLGLYPRFAYGDRLQITCKSLKKPERFDDFRWDMYLARYGVFLQCLGPQVKKLGGFKGSGLKAMILTVKGNFAGTIDRLWHEPYASFMAGLLYGYRGGLGELQEHFNRVGITHIVAISGYNIAIIAAVLHALLTHLYVPRKKAFWIIFFGIVIFVFFTGASASVVRAGIMGILVLLAKYIGRVSKPVYVLTATATAMILHNPLVLLWDAGFQLSFASTVGLIYLSDRMESWFYFLPNRLGIRESGASTMAAIIATLPLILFLFGRLSIVAPIANILVLWSIPLIMLIGFSSVVIGYLFLPLAQVFSWVAFIGLKYVIVVAKWLASFSFATVDVKFSFLSACFAYALIWYIFRNKKGPNLVSYN